MIITGDSTVELKKLEANSIDSVVTDPPYGLAFMNKHWDYDVPSVELWREVLRVLKPGGHLLSFGGTRTYHRMVVNIEDAGFEIRDQIMWIYGSGFPKSQDVSKAIDKQAGAEREVIGESKRSQRRSEGWDRPWMQEQNANSPEQMSAFSLTAPATDAAKQWQGFGTALKPAVEPIVLARKPLEPKLTVAANVLKHGTGAINVDASRIATNEKLAQGASDLGYHGVSEPVKTQQHTQGRWPANVLFDEEAAAVLDEQSGVSKSGGGISSGKTFHGQAYLKGHNERPTDAGGASRFFYVAKASKRERNAGLEGMPDTQKYKQDGSGNSHEVFASGGDEAWQKKNPCLPTKNHHPTVKPIKLMEYLVRMITPPGGVVLDPFCGSGTTGCAAKQLGFSFIGIEREADYVEIARKRIEQLNKSILAEEIDDQCEMLV